MKDGGDFTRKAQKRFPYTIDGGVTKRDSSIWNGKIQWKVKNFYFSFECDPLFEITRKKKLKFFVRNLPSAKVPQRDSTRTAKHLVVQVTCA